MATGLSPQRGLHWAMTDTSRTAECCRQHVLHFSRVYVFSAGNNNVLQAIFDVAKPVGINYGYIA
jgi:hypothetical protein